MVFTRYLESVFDKRSAAAVIREQYDTKKVPSPAKIGSYKSGPEYSLKRTPDEKEEFDSGGEFHSKNHVPLLTHFSLRHGFKESKFSVTAASESLTEECLAPWTLMTLSHEIMHSRVRHILHVLFGTSWDDNPDDRWDVFFERFSSWYRHPEPESNSLPVADVLRNAVLNFCSATQRAEDVVASRRTGSDLDLRRDEVLACFRKHKRLAAELFVHFHDYYFAYACQPKIYVMSLWASWTTVAAPVARPREYLVRTLATIACGTGVRPKQAFEGAVEILEDGLIALEATGIKSPLFEELRALLKDERTGTYAHFIPAYYLLDHVRRYFASTAIAENIDRLETDQFAEGSSEASSYSASIYVYGATEGPISPIRYSVAMLYQQLSGSAPNPDHQWLTAWSSMVISSQEIIPC